MQIYIGGGLRGYDSAEVTKTATGKYRLVPGTVSGRITIIRKVIAAANRGETSYVTPSGDYLEIHFK